MIIIRARQWMMILGSAFRSEKFWMHFGAVLASFVETLGLN